MGKLSQATDVSAVRLLEAASAGTPPSGYGDIRLGADGNFYAKNDTGLEILLGGSLGVAQPTPTELTIASGAITVTQGFHKIDTEADAGTDNLDTINGLVANAWYLFKPEDNARVVKFRHAFGNIVSPTLSDVVMTAAGIWGWSDGTNFYPQTASNPNDVDTWNSYPDNTLNFPAYDSSSGEMFSITGDEIQLWKTYQLSSAFSFDAASNLHFVLDSATAFLSTINASTIAAGMSWVAQVLTAPGAGTHDILLPSGVTWDGTNRRAQFSTTADLLEGRFISATRFLLKPTTTGVSFAAS